MNRFGIRIFVFLLFVALMQTGCGEDQKKAAEQAVVKKAIAKYNNALIEVYNTQDIEPLKKIATEKRTSKIEKFVAAYLSHGLVMDSELLHMDFLKIDAKGDTATVWIKEKWTYRWLQIDKGGEALPNENITYEMRYNLIKKNDFWLVDDATDTKTENSITPP